MTAMDPYATIAALRDEPFSPRPTPPRAVRVGDAWIVPEQAAAVVVVNERVTDPPQDSSFPHGPVVRWDTVVVLVSGAQVRVGGREDGARWASFGDARRTQQQHVEHYARVLWGVPGDEPSRHISESFEAVAAESNFQGPILVYPAPGADRRDLIIDIGTRSGVRYAVFARREDLPEHLHYWEAAEGSEVR